jgi:hypothetical protein
MAFGAANMSICHKLSIGLDSVGSGLRSLYSRAGAQLRYMPWISVSYVAFLQTWKDVAFLQTWKVISGVGLDYGYDIFTQSYGKMRHGFWSRQHEHLSQTFHRLRLCWVLLEVIVH